MIDFIFIFMHFAAIVKILLPIVEIETKKIIQQSAKFQKRSKANKLTVHDINLALHMNRSEEIYGLCGISVLKQESVVLLESDKNQLNPSITIDATKIDLSELAKQPLPKIPLAPQVSFHWLAVDGSQPKIPENPNLIVVDREIQPSALPREMQFFYSRTTGSILAQDKNTLPAIMHAFQYDSGFHRK